jgi:hypothetical protein
MAYYPFAYFIQPNSSTDTYESGSCPACNASVKSCGPSTDAPCGPCPGTGRPNPSQFPVLGSDTSCHPDEPDEHFYDNGLATDTIARLQHAANLFHSERRPFFIMSGFARPHMPQRMPKRFYDLYESVSPLPVATHKLPPDGMPGIAYFQFGFYNSSSGYVWPLDIAKPVPDEAAREMRRSYYASVSWLDFCVGRVLDSLEAHKLKQSTTVVLHGDQCVTELSLYLHARFVHKCRMPACGISNFDSACVMR